jgi:hypothetical protein
MYKGHKGTGVGNAALIAPHGTGPSLSQTMPMSGGITHRPGAAPTIKSTGRKGLKSYYYKGGLTGPGRVG